MLMRCTMAVNGNNVEFCQRILKLLHCVILKTSQLVPHYLRYCCHDATAVRAVADLYQQIGYHTCHLTGCFLKIHLLSHTWLSISIN